MTSNSKPSITGIIMSVIDGGERVLKQLVQRILAVGRQRNLQPLQLQKLAGDERQVRVVPTNRMPCARFRPCCSSGLKVTVFCTAKTSCVGATVLDL